MGAVMLHRASRPATIPQMRGISSSTASASTGQLSHAYPGRREVRARACQGVTALVCELVREPTYTATGDTQLSE
jgi:hypothetical protein